MNSLNKRVCFLATFLGLMIVLTSCSLGLAKKTGTPEVKKSNFATTTEKISTTTEGRIASSTDDMSNWKTYSNKIIGIEFKYPPTWPTLTKDNVGDNDGDKKKSGIRFVLELIDLSGIYHMGSPYENLSINEQYQNTKCPENGSIIKCRDELSRFGVKYSWNVWTDKKFGDSHGAIVEAEKYILTFDFGDAGNYNKRAGEYQKLLSSLKIPE